MKKINFIFLRSLIGSDSSFKDEQKRDFLARLNNDNDFIFDGSGEDIFFIETGGTEEQFKKVYLSYKEPYVIVATDANNSLPASLEIATYLRNNNKKFRLIHGSPEEVKKQLKNEENVKISKNCGGFLNTNALNGTRFGVVGHPSDWLIASDVNYALAKTKLGTEIIDISSEEFLDQISKENDEKITTKFDCLLNEKVNEKTLSLALRIYKALKTIVRKYNLDGITVRCFDLLDSVKNTSCLALAMLNEEGIIATCEGDIPAMLTMGLIKKIFGKSSFQVNPSYINVEKRIAYFAHCTLPLDMCKSFGFDTHFESGIGIGIKGKLYETNVTIFKMNADLIHYEVFEGHIVENLDKNNLCRTQVKIQFDEDINEIINAPNGNHLLIFYGSFKAELIKILSY